MTARRLTKAELEQIRKRTERARGGPWRAENDQGLARLYRWCRDDKYNETGQEWEPITYGNRAPLAADDAEFCAAARTDIPALLAEVEALAAERDRYRAVLDNAAATIERYCENCDKDHLADCRFCRDYGRDACPNDVRDDFLDMRNAADGARRALADSDNDMEGTK